MIIINHIKKVLNITLLIFLALLLCLILSVIFIKNRLPTDLPAVSEQRTWVIDHVNIVDVENLKVDYERQILIEDGIITTINPAGSEVPDFYDVIDAKNAYIIPGLFDMHVHLSDRKQVLLNLSMGVTSLRMMRGMAMHLRWKQELQEQRWVGSNLYLSSPILDGPNTGLFSQAVHTAADAKKMVNKAHEDGFDFIKAYGYLTAEGYQAILEQAKKRGMPVAKHGPGPIQGLGWPSLAGLQSLEHAEDIFQGPLNYQFDEGKLTLVAQKIKALNVMVTPTLSGFYHLSQLSLKKQSYIDTLPLEYLSPFYRFLEKKYSVNRWLADTEQAAQFHQKKMNFLVKIVNSLHEHGVELLVGSDAGTMYTIPGLALHEEMNLMHEAGLSNLMVIKSATLNAARALNVADQFGSIKVGKQADMVLINDNPLESLTHLREPEIVFKAGQLFSRIQLQQFHKIAKNTNGFYWSFVSFLEDFMVRKLGY